MPSDIDATAAIVNAAGPGSGANLQVDNFREQANAILKDNDVSVKFSAVPIVVFVFVFFFLFHVFLLLFFVSLSRVFSCDCRVFFLAFFRFFLFLFFSGRLTVLLLLLWFVGCVVDVATVVVFIISTIVKVGVFFFQARHR